jgi:hypothetical protein
VLVGILRANVDVFAWSPSDMPGIPRDVAEHLLEPEPDLSRSLYADSTGRSAEP